MCSRKTNNKGAAALYNGSYNPSMMDKRRDDAMDADEFDFFENLWYNKYRKWDKAHTAILSSNIRTANSID